MNSKNAQRGAAEEKSKSPMTETEARASQRPAGEGDQPTERREEQRTSKHDIEGDDAAQRRAVGR